MDEPANELGTQPGRSSGGTVDPAASGFGVAEFRLENRFGSLLLTLFNVRQTMNELFKEETLTVMKLCGFADEIAPELDEQIKCCKGNGVTHFELRGVYGKNVLDFDKSVRIEIKSKLKDNGMGVASIGSPIGKVKIDEPWDKYFDRFKIAVDSAEFFECPS